MSTENYTKAEVALFTCKENNLCEPADRRCMKTLTKFITRDTEPAINFINKSS